MTEIWRDIKDYEGLYQVSNLGRVKSLEHKVKNKHGYRTVKERILKTFLDGGGYVQVYLYKNNTRTHYHVHRLVAQAFKPNPYNKPCINHLNKIRTDNRVDNLEWCTHEENNNWSDHNELISIAKTGVFNIKGKSKPVLQYTMDMVFIKEYPSVQEANRQTGIQVSSICNVCNCKRGLKSTGGYIWKYKD